MILIDFNDLLTGSVVSINPLQVVSVQPHASYTLVCMVTGSQVLVDDSIDAVKALLQAS